MKKIRLVDVVKLLPQEVHVYIMQNVLNNFFANADFLYTTKYNMISYQALSVASVFFEHPEVNQLACGIKLHNSCLEVVALTDENGYRVTQNTSYLLNPNVYNKAYKSMIEFQEFVYAKESASFRRN